MKLLSNFDTGLEQRLVDEYVAAFGVDKVVSVHKSKLFYRKYVGLPLFVYVCLLFISFYFLFREDILETWMIWVYVGFFVLYGIVLMRSISSKWVDYKMDFLIVTPREIVKYDQQGVFEKHIEKLHADKIKSITISKKGFVQSIFDIGRIVFLAEGSDDKGDIVMQFVDAVEYEEKRIVQVLGMHEE